MATTSWVRPALGPLAYSTTKASWLITSLSAGQTVLRTRFGWSFGGYTSTTVIPTSMIGQRVRFGIVTTIGPAGTDSPPDPVTQGADQHPPSQRWLWLEERYAQLLAWDGAANTAIWGSTAPNEPSDSQGQVLAPVMAVGSTLNVWAVVNATFPWDATGQAVVNAYANVLVRTP